MSVNGAGLFFLDTNILVYSFDRAAKDKQTTAQGIIKLALETQRGIVSTQVVQEFISVLLQKFKQPSVHADAREFLQTVLMPLCQHYPSLAFYDRALMLQQETGYGWYDTLILAAALETGCRTLLSEDLQAGRSVHGVTIVNPFV